MASPSGNGRAVAVAIGSRLFEPRLQKVFQAEDRVDSAGAASGSADSDQRDGITGHTIAVALRRDEVVAVGRRERFAHQGFNRAPAPSGPSPPDLFKGEI